MRSPSGDPLRGGRPDGRGSRRWIARLEGLRPQPEEHRFFDPETVASLTNRELARHRRTLRGTDLRGVGRRLTLCGWLYLGSLGRSNATVPEPGGWLQLFLGLLPALFDRRARRPS